VVAYSYKIKQNVDSANTYNSMILAIDPQNNAALANQKAFEGFLKKNSAGAAKKEDQKK